ncbi:MAG: hypothetical protein WAU88_03190 [Candidatus Zixiibacteriota bacterium]
MKRQLCVFLIVGVIQCSSAWVAAQVPELVSYQGRLTDPSGIAIPNGVYSVQFTIYGDSTATQPFAWQETHSVATTDGLFSVNLGKTDPLDRGVLLNLPYVALAYLGIKVGTDPELFPRVRLTSVLYAQEAVHALVVTTVNGATGGAITGSVKISDSLGVGLNGYPPSERLDIGGNVSVSGKVIIQSNAGTTIKPLIGERWRDNGIVAWGNVGPDGSLYSAFGVDSVKHTSIGHYQVYISNSFPNSADMIVMAQAYSDIENHMLTSVRPITGSMIQVGLKLFNINDFFDGQFVFVVTGR